MSSPVHTTGRQYRGVPEQERQRERRARLIEAGIQVFGEHGYSASTVKSVCVAAGLTERYFYESFANREELFKTVYLFLVDRLRSAVIESVTSRSTPIEMAKLGLTTYFLSLRNDPRMARIILVEVLRVNSQIDSLGRQTMNQFEEVLRMFGPVFFETEASRYDLELMAAALAGGVLNISTTWFLSGYRKPLGTVVDHCVMHFEAVRQYLQSISRDELKK